MKDKHNGWPQHGGIFVDGLYIPPVGLFGFPDVGRVWHFRNWMSFARIGGENWDERRALIETLHYRVKESGAAPA